MWNLIFTITLAGSPYYSQSIEGVYEAEAECKSVVKTLSTNVSEGIELTIVEDDYSHIYVVKDGWKVNVICKEV